MYLTRVPANIIPRTDHLEFLSDLVPQNITWRNHKAKKAREADAGMKGNSLLAGQTTIDGQKQAPVLIEESSTVSDSAPSDSPVTNGTKQSGSSKGLVFQHYEPKGQRKTESQGDANDMT